GKICDAIPVGPYASRNAGSVPRKKSSISARTTGCFSHTSISSAGNHDSPGLTVGDVTRPAIDAMTPPRSGSPKNDGLSRKTKMYSGESFMSQRYRDALHALLPIDYTNRLRRFDEPTCPLPPRRTLTYSPTQVCFEVPHSRPRRAFVDFSKG